MYGGHYLSTTKLIQIIKKEKPDIVHLQCINSSFVNIYRLITYLKNHQIKPILTLHAEFMYTANCGSAFDCNKWETGCGHCPRLKQETRSLFFDATAYSWRRMKRAFDGFKENLVIASVSPWLMQRAKLSPILADKKHVVVMNGLDTEVFHHYSINHLRAELGIRNDEKVIFHATPNFTDNPKHIKGGRFVIELAKRMPHVHFVVAGPIYGESPKVPSNVLLLGTVTDSNRLAMLYSMADMTLLTSKKETFSMVCAESLSCGTPVVGFQAGAPEQISLPDYSCFVEYGNIDSLQHATEKFLTQSFNHKEVEEKARERYSKEVMAQNYIKLYHFKNTKS
jgi:glycosyltransferase involved in cell wall biosynthesis